MANNSKKEGVTKIKVVGEARVESKLTLEIAEALKEVKLMQEGKIQPLSLKDIYN
jgi:hypothetical protein